MVFRAFFRMVLLTILLCIAVAGTAQQFTEAQRKYHEGWLATAQRAENVLSAKRASNAALEQLRSEIAEYRDTFDTNRSSEDDRIATLQSQLDALGPAPEAGQVEAQGIAELRERLNEQLNRLRVPQIISEEAYTRANGLIGEIDATIWERTKSELMSRGPSPLNLALWPAAYRSAYSASQSLYYEITENLKGGIVKAQISNRAPAILLTLLVGVFLFAKGRRWSDRLGDYLRSLGGAGNGVWSFVVSIARILFPWLGVVFIVTAISLSGIPGVRSTLLLDQVPYLAGIFLYIDWIRRQIISNAIQDSPDGHVAQNARQYSVFISLLSFSLIFHQLLKLFEQVEDPSAETLTVLTFPVILVTGLVLLRLMRLRGVAQAKDNEDEDTQGKSGFYGFVELVRRVLYVLGVVSPILALLGYSKASEAIIFPSVATLVLIATLVIFHRFSANLYGWLSGKGTAASESLFVVIIGFLIALLSIPVLALIWGARPAELAEAWSTLMNGFDVGGVTISPTIFFVFAAVFAFGYTLTRLLQGGLRNSLLPKTRMDAGGQNAVVSGVGYIGIFITALLAIVSAGIDLTALGYVAGALSVGIGFGLQNIVSNFVSGIILLIERPISKDDWIDVNGQMGYVRDISVRSTRIETFDRTDVIVPNSDLISGTVTNYTRGNTVGRVIVPVGVAYGTDTKTVEKILSDIANSHPMVLAYPAPSVVFQGFGADSLDFEIRAILRDVNWVLSVKSDMNHKIAQRFAEAGIEIPFAQRDIWLRNPEALTGSPRHQSGLDQVDDLTEASEEPSIADSDQTDKDGDTV